MPSTIERERWEVRDAYQRVEQLEALEAELEAAHALTRDQARRLHEVTRATLRSISPVRIPIASELLGLTERTVRSWAERGVLTPAEAETSRLVLDPERLHEVVHLVRELRAAGRRSEELLNAVWFRLEDQTVFDREELRESLDELRRGDTVRAY